MRTRFGLRGVAAHASVTFALAVSLVTTVFANRPARACSAFAISNALAGGSGTVRAESDDLQASGFIWNGGSPEDTGFIDFRFDFASGDPSAPHGSITCADSQRWSSLADGHSAPLAKLCAFNPLSGASGEPPEVHVARQGVESVYPLTEGAITAESGLDAKGNTIVTVRLDVPSVDLAGPDGTSVHVELHALTGTAVLAESNECGNSSGSGCGSTYTGWRPGGG